MEVREKFDEMNRFCFLFNRLDEAREEEFVFETEGVETEVKKGNRGPRRRLEEVGPEAEGLGGRRFEFAQKLEAWT